MKRMMALVLVTLVAPGCGVDAGEETKSTRAPLTWEPADPGMRDALRTLDEDPAYTSQLRNLVADPDFQIEIENMASQTQGEPDAVLLCQAGYLKCRLGRNSVMTCRHLMKKCIISSLPR